MFAKKQYKNEYETFILAQIGAISSKWNHANTYMDYAVTKLAPRTNYYIVQPKYEFSFMWSDRLDFCRIVHVKVVCSLFTYHNL